MELRGRCAERAHLVQQPAQLVELEERLKVAAVDALHDGVDGGAIRDAQREARAGVLLEQRRRGSAARRPKVRFLRERARTGRRRARRRLDRRRAEQRVQAKVEIAEKHRAVRAVWGNA